MSSMGTKKFVSFCPHQEAREVHQADAAELLLCGRYTSALAAFLCRPSFGVLCLDLTGLCIDCTSDRALNSRESCMWTLAESALCSRDRQPWTSCVKSNVRRNGEEGASSAVGTVPTLSHTAIFRELKVRRST